MLNVLKIKGDYKGLIEQTQKIMVMMKENNPESVKTHDYVRNFLLLTESHMLQSQLQEAEYNLNQATNILAKIASLDDDIYLELYLLQARIFMQ